MSSISEENSGPSLKELVTKNLETNGIIGKLQAQLRASVFLILEEEFKEKNIPLTNEKSLQILSSPVGKIAVGLVQDFLQCLTLDFTMAVFCPESKSTLLEKQCNRQNLDQELGSKLSTAKGENYPVLLQLIEERLNCQNQHSEKKNGFTNNTSTPNLNTADPPLKTSRQAMDAKEASEADKSDPVQAKQTPLLNGEQVPGTGMPTEPTNKEGVQDQSQGENYSEPFSENDESSLSTMMSSRSSSDKSTMSGIEKVSDEEASDSLKRLEEKSEERGSEEERTRVKEGEKKEEKKKKKKEEEEEEEEEEMAEDIEEDLTEEGISSSKSMTTEETQDVVLSKEGMKPDYEESL